MLLVAPTTQVAITFTLSESVSSFTLAKREALNAKNIELSAELDLMRERHEVLSALGKFNPEDLANVSRTNAALASSIQALLPKLDTKKPDLGGEPLSSSGLSAPIFPSTQMV